MSVPVARMFRTRERGGHDESARRLVPAVLVLGVVLGLTACGRKGPPLPPFVRVPAAPADMKVARRADAVELQFTVPTANTDGTRPANVERIDVYGFAGPDIQDEELRKLGRLKVATVMVKAPRDPDATVEPDEPAADMDPLGGAGLDQGAVARVQLDMNTVSLVAPDLAKKRSRTQVIDDGKARPLLGPPAAVASLTLVGVGVSKSGRAGAMSPRMHVPLVPPPPPPSSPQISYDATAITVTWSAHDAAPHESDEAAPALSARPIWFPAPEIGYFVYEVAPPSAESDSAPREPKPADTRLSESPVNATEYVDHRIVWGTERCYVVRSVETIGGQALESDASAPACEKLVDTFPPAAPTGLVAVAGERVINLIWEPNSERDLAGYIVLRGTSPDTLQPIMTSPMQETIFRDGVPAGAHYFYAVKAVDKAGNGSAASDPDQATARE